MDKRPHRNSDAHRAWHCRDSARLVCAHLADAIQADVQRPLNTTSPRGLIPRGDGARAGKLRQLILESVLKSPYAVGGLGVDLALVRPQVLGTDEYSLPFILVST